MRSQYDDLFRYTGGRWLWDEKARLAERYKEFDVLELQRLAVRVTGSEECVSISKVAEGGFNKVLRLALNNGTSVIARIPNLDSNNTSLSIASEVATMDFVRTILGLPVPRVLSWSADPSCAIKSEYLLMEEADGTQLSTLWPTMDIGDQVAIAKQIVSIEERLMRIDFRSFGNLYFKRNAPPGCHPIHVATELPSPVKEEIADKFVMGPVVDQDFWAGERARMNIDRGPWSSPDSYIQAIASREVEWLERFGPQKPNMYLEPHERVQPDVAEYVSLYRTLQTVAKHLPPKQPEYSRSCLWHWDLHAPNIFVRDNKITSIIDWQDVWAGPLFLQARHPRLVDYNGEVKLTLPDNYESINDKDEKSRIKEGVRKSLILWSYETRTRKENPLLHQIFHMPMGRTIKDTVAFASSSADGDIMPLRGCLIRIARHWAEIDDGTLCPVSFTGEELEKHFAATNNWNETADFWDSLRGFVTRDGWTTFDDYDEALNFFSRLREEMLSKLERAERDEVERQTRWAICLPERDTASTLSKD